MPNHLIPTPIVNKLGVATTVHKRVDHSATSAKPLPAPMLMGTTPQQEDPEQAHRREVIARIVEFAVKDLDSAFDMHDQFTAGADRYRTDILDCLDRMISDPPRYTSYLLNGLGSRFTMDSSFVTSIEISAHEVSNKLHDAGFDNFSVSTHGVEKYFGTRTNRYLKDSHIQDYRLHCLTRAFDMDDPSIFQDGPIDYYRQVADMGNYYDDVVKSLPVIKALLKDDGVSILEDIRGITEVSRHVGRHTDEEIRRIASFVSERDMDFYDEDMIEEMLSHPAGPMLNDGVL